MNDIEFERVRSYAARTHALDLSAKRILLECRLSRERQRFGVASFSAYFDLVERGDNPEAQARFVDLITTHYTYFMRESSQFAFLTETAFPELERRRPNRTWNILCAGCSTGEECYTLAMLAEDYAVKRRTPPPVRITGIDLSEPALAQARRAGYPPAHVEKVPSRWLSAYFTHRDGEYFVNDALRNRVTFHRGNLDDPSLLFRTYDLVLCRNVIIYLEKDARERVIDLLQQHLATQGYLLLGHAEIVRDNPCLVYRGNSVYQKHERATDL
ncbi:CheR family methyltransferase [Eggerthella sinensis]|uniref:CheR family methyltransferase n=1 Tax=Eggerthella sinensis TaxID=242230 RepID=UPI0022E790E1|nr:protein-glutamate O-methyltransferase CheR [Eggerthella sinensis]